MKKKQQKGTKLLQNVTSVYLALLLTVFLFYVGPEGYQGITGAKYSAFLALCIGYIGVMVLLLAECALVGAVKLPTTGALWRHSNWCQRFAVVYLAATWISAVVSPHWPDTLLGVSRSEGALTITVYCLCFLLVSVFGTVGKWMLPLFAVAVTAFDVLAIVQLGGGNPFLLYPAGYNYFGAGVDYGGAYLGTIGNVDLVAAFLCLAVGVLWVAILRGRERRRFWLFLPLAASIYVLFKMWVLSGIVGILCGTAPALGVVLPVSRKRKGIIFSLVAGFALALLLALYFVDVGGGMLHEVHELLHGRADDTFGSGRIYIWKNVLARIPGQFWWGSGPDTMQLAGIEPFRRFDEALNAVILSQIDVAHNVYLNIFYHQGVLAFLAYMAMLLGAGRRWLRDSGESRAVAALGTGLLGYGIQTFFGFDACCATIYFWMFLGLLVSISGKNRERGAAD